MKNSGQKKPVVLVFSGHDPSGAAGIHADIESIALSGCHCASVITATTAQNTTRFEQIYPQAPAHFKQQIETLLSDIKVDACKIGLIGSSAIAAIIAETLPALGNIPIVLDPVIAAGTGTEVADKALQALMIERLFPSVTLLTPNTKEARELTDTENIQACVIKLFQYGCENILVTGTDENTARVSNSLFCRDQAPVSFEWERLADTFHGSGCTLSAHTAGLLARGMDMKSAVARAQHFTWQSLKQGRKLGKGQTHPDRFFSA